MKSIIILFSLIGFCYVSEAQVNISTQKYVGCKDTSYYFFQYGLRKDNIIPAIISYELSDKNYFINPKIAKWDIKKGSLIYKDSEFEIHNGQNEKNLTIVYNGKEIKFKTEPIYNFSIVNNIGYNKVYFSTHAESPIYIFDKTNFELLPTPLIGSNLHLRNEFLFFQAPRYSDNYSSFPDDIYRVKLDDLKNPEKVLIQVMGRWYPYTENILYAYTTPKLKLCSEKKCGGFYDIKNGLLAISPTIATQKIIHIGNKPYILEQTQKAGVQKTFMLEEVISPPEVFSYVIDSIENQKPRGEIFKWHNIPLKEKQLHGTFINHDLLYNSSKDELEKLTKEQLRLLRNTFYAFHGYNFKSIELVNFFSQFNWYKKMIMGNKLNKDLILWKDEIKRVKLIRSIEEAK